MTRATNILGFRFSFLLLVPLVLGAGGCGGPTTYSVKGKVELSAGDVRNLAGNSLEAALESDTNVRAFGEIKEDGSFALDTLSSGAIRKGAPEGKYQVRLVLQDDDQEKKQATAAILNPRFLQFQSSGLSLQVPAATAVTLRITPE